MDTISARLTARAIGTLLAICMVITTGGIAGAAHDTAPCADVGLVFARGSGQVLDQREAPAFFDRITANMPAGVTVNAYEVGTEAHGGATYPAYGIGIDSVQSFKNLLEADAAWTGVAGGEYRESVRRGITEMSLYLTLRARECPDEILVVGGYSQGAQVTGETLAVLPEAVRDQIAYVGLLGDPKLYLPEGRGPWPPACRGKEFSPWRRGNVSCWTDNGILEGRDPYVPSDMEDRTGSWCDREDGICNGLLTDVLFGSTHGDYADRGAELDELVAEASAAIAGRLPADVGSGVNVIPIRLSAGADGLDVAFVVDTTGSMAGRIGSAVNVAAELGQQVVDVDGRVALTEYRDRGDAFVARIRHPLSQDISGFNAQLSTLRARGGGDSPEALLAALMTTFDGLSWTPGATKAAIVLTDAGFHNPDRATGHTIEDVVARSLEIDPVNVFAVVPSFRVSLYEELTERTAGRVFSDAGGTSQALLDAFGEITSRPVVFLDFERYFAQVGEPITFRADAYDVDGDVVEYRWDLDGDGAFELTTTDPTVERTYDAPFDAFVEVRAISSDGGVGSSSARVQVGGAGLAGLAPLAPVDVTADVADPAPGADQRTVTLSWEQDPTSATVDNWSLIGSDGQVIAVLPAEARQVIIDDAPMEAFSLRLAGANSFGTGEAVTVDVASASVAVRAEVADVADRIAPRAEVALTPGDPFAKAAADLRTALADDAWPVDDDHLAVGGGHQALTALHQAARELDKVADDRLASEDDRALAAGSATDLVAAVRRLVEVLTDDLQGLTLDSPGDQRTRDRALERAAADIDRAERAATAGDLGKAVLEFGKAWADLDRGWQDLTDGG